MSVANSINSRILTLLEYGLLRVLTYYASLSVGTQNNSQGEAESGVLDFHSTDLLRSRLIIPDLWFYCGNIDLDLRRNKLAIASQNPPIKRWGSVI
ncbi:MAG: hypothetical protein ABEI13_00265 [Candidatus Paceibacteria bacterium]